MTFVAFARNTQRRLMSDILKKILATKGRGSRRRVPSNRWPPCVPKLKCRPAARNSSPPCAAGEGGAKPAVIAEIQQKANMLQGVLRADFRPAEIAATTSSTVPPARRCLTDRQFFQGAPRPAGRRAACACRCCQGLPRRSVSGVRGAGEGWTPSCSSDKPLSLAEMQISRPSPSAWACRCWSRCMTARNWIWPCNSRRRWWASTTAICAPRGQPAELRSAAAVSRQIVLVVTGERHPCASRCGADAAE